MHPEVKSCIVFPMNAPVEATLDRERGPGWVASLEGQYVVSTQFNYVCAYIYTLHVMTDSQSLHQ